MNVVYHFTDLVRFTWIAASGELQPSRNKAGGYPDPDFVWATTDGRGCRTAAGLGNWSREQVKRDIELPVVRLTLDAEDFEPWRAIAPRYPAWTPRHIDALEASAIKRRDDPRTWRCRVEPLSLSRVRLIEARTYTSSWRPIELPTEITFRPTRRHVTRSPRSHPNSSTRPRTA
jgi:hypothetical protein